MTDFRTASESDIRGREVADIGNVGEIIIDTTNDTIVVENGSVEGVSLARADLANASISGIVFKYLTRKTATFANVADGSLKQLREAGDDLEIGTNGELIIRVPGIYFDITVPFDKIRNIRSNSVEGTTIDISETNSQNAIKVMDINNIEVFVGRTGDNKLTVKAFDKSSIERVDITEQLEFHFREINIPGTPRGSFYSNPQHGDVAYYDRNNGWTKGKIHITLEPLGVGETPGIPGSDPHTKLRTVGINIGTEGDGEIVIGYDADGSGITAASHGDVSIPYSRLRSIDPKPGNGDPKSSSNSVEFKIDDATISLSIDATGNILALLALTITDPNTGTVSITDDTGALIFHRRVAVIS